MTTDAIPNDSPKQQFIDTGFFCLVLIAVSPDTGDARRATSWKSRLRKNNTFPFTRYGVIAAQVDPIHSQGATVDENQGLIYRTRLSLEKSTLIVDGRQTQLMLGIVVTAEITTGKRRLIEFFLAPLLRAKQESLRER